MERTLEMLAAEVEERLDPDYELVYVDYRDNLMEEQVAAIVRGDWDTLYESLDDFVNEQQWMSACDIVDEVSGRVLREWEDEDEESHPVLEHEWQMSGERQTLIESVLDSDTSTPLDDLARQTEDVVVRATICGEDDCWSFEPIEPEELLQRTGLPITDANLEAAGEALANACPEYSVIMVSALAPVEVREALAWPHGGKLVIHNPTLWLGNPFAGSGWIADFEGALVIDRQDIRTDKDAWGYSWDAVVGGDYASNHPGSVFPADNDEMEATA